MNPAVEPVGVFLVAVLVAVIFAVASAMVAGGLDCFLAAVYALLFVKGSGSRVDRGRGPWVIVGRAQRSWAAVVVLIIIAAVIRSIQG